MEGSAMTLYEFRCALRDVRNNCKQMRTVLGSLKDARNDELSTVFSGAIDYSVDKVQHQTDPDASTINAIVRANKKEESLLEKYKKLESENEPYEKLIYSASGIGSEVVRLYVLEGMKWDEVADRIQLTVRYCHILWNRTTIELWEKYENNHK